MVELIGYDDNTYKVKVTEETTLGDDIGNELAAMVIPLLEDNKLITIELNDINSFKDGGYNTISDLFRLSVENNCMLKFTHVHDDIFELIDAFSYEEEG